MHTRSCQQCCPSLCRLSLLSLILAALAWCGAATSNASLLPDTGQTTCYNAALIITCPGPGQDYYGQDANYQARPPSYRNNGDGTVSDLVTGLSWQQAYDNVPRTREDASAYCQALGLGGFDDWRLPSRRDLLGLVNAGYVNPPIDPVFTCAKDAYWTDTDRLGSSGYVWFVDFILGASSYGPQTIQEHFRCVRGEAMPQPSFHDNLDQTVTDSSTGLTWEQAASASAMNWKEALAWCQARTTAGKTDWRLPNKRELESLVVDARTPPVLDPVFQGAQTTYWSGTTANWTYAWHVHFYYGESSVTNKTWPDNRVRCVRGGLHSPPATATTLLFLEN
ncbi:MAG: DUF1566 domain-containing protein [Solidesulfovibrio sp. DCME]|uniref:Lcl C-terminal domain-containing protein n=1 Tax=Solidesulfovibrio sp. DCME TaxID=3447380 RepID=UPI003D0FB099